MSTLESTLEQLQSDRWESVPVNQVSIELARQIRAGQIPTAKPPVQVVSRIQVLMVEAGICTDAEFIEALRGEQP